MGRQPAAESLAPRDWASCLEVFEHLDEENDEDKPFMDDEDCEYEDDEFFGGLKQWAAHGPRDILKAGPTWR